MVGPEDQANTFEPLQITEGHLRIFFNKVSDMIKEVFEEGESVSIVWNVVTRKWTCGQKTVT